ncbi:L-threonine 3-O-phosphate decarboxylase [hydrothermal vent metagenome]|uniref:threonine-phosphate decarboxylase n=1 Tax=hydrothermal vent metagenome TaxID=652676 RepID=A0A3B0ZYW0_9ZZZZ
MNTIINIKELNESHCHGGQLNSAVNKYNIPKSEWLDLSTGINPNSYPISDIPVSVWHRLPENDDDLLRNAANYYQCKSVIAVAGSQVAIQLIPSLFSKATVGLIQPGYYEHAKHWAEHNHTVVKFQHKLSHNNNFSLIDDINKKINTLDVLVIINPNNPTGVCFNKQQLIQWHEILIKRNAYLIIDEAFMDTDQSNTLLSAELLPNLIVLRSLGKFFGLAGIRVGFVFSNKKILDKISKLQGPWPISGPSRWLASKALADTSWQNITRINLYENSKKLKSLLSHHNLIPSGGSNLFQWVKTEHAELIFNKLNQNAILTRLFKNPSSLRFGLPKNELQWKKLDDSLERICVNLIIE